MRIRESRLNKPLFSAYVLLFGCLAAFAVSAWMQVFVITIAANTAVTWVLAVGMAALTVAALITCGAFFIVFRFIRVLINLDEDESLLKDPIRFFKNKRLNRMAGTLIGKINKELEKEYSTQLLELKVLQNQINPHFLYNTLELIRGKALIDEKTDIADMTRALASLFRYSISRKGDMVTLEEEMRNLGNYLTIQQYRFNNKFIVEINIDADDLLTAELPKMSLQPLVENSIYHGLETKIGKGHIDISVKEYEDRITVEISDDGLGIEEEKLKELNNSLLNYKNEFIGAEGIGITNVNKRLKLCFGEMYGLKLFSTYGMGTDVELSIPKKIKQGEQVHGERKTENL